MTDEGTDRRTTLGGKIKAARLEAGLTQDEMAGKLFVSRQAITKWENNKGVPDIGNLRRLAQLLDVSVDYLLNDGTDAGMATRMLREPVDLAAVDAHRSANSGWSLKAAKKDTIVRRMWPHATIHRLVSEPILTHDEKVMDNVLGFFTPHGSASHRSSTRSGTGVTATIWSTAVRTSCSSPSPMNSLKAAY